VQPPSGEKKTCTLGCCGCWREGGVAARFDGAVVGARLGAVVGAEPKLRKEVTTNRKATDAREEENSFIDNFIVR
jgi:hypothetical protein